MARIHAVEQAMGAVLLAGALALIGGCAKRTPASAPGTSPLSPPGTPATAARAGPPEPLIESPLVPPEPVPEQEFGARPLDELNRDSPLRPAFFAFDSAELGGEAREVLSRNAELLKKYPTWAVTVEGHCDERGTAEYNLALGERRALAARNYLVALGIAARRLRTVSYGEEFPFDPGDDETAWSKNRRAHFVITAK